MGATLMRVKCCEHTGAMAMARADVKRVSRPAHDGGDGHTPPVMDKWFQDFPASEPVAAPA